MNKVFIITGQTATGKTSYALKLADKYNGEIINCDARQIYKKLDIITGKDINPGSKFNLISKLSTFDIGYYQINNIKIWLYDIVDPKQYFSSFDYMKCVILVIQDILSRKKTPIIVGGTYLYLFHLLYDVETENIQANWKLREELNKKNITELQKIITSLSSDILTKMNNSDRNNPRRLIRKIEILKSGVNIEISNFKPQQIFQINNKLAQPVQIKFIGYIYKDKIKLQQVITNRVKDRIKNGAIDEVQSLLKNGYNEKDPGLKTIGYRQIISYIKGNQSKSELIQQWVSKEIQYAKRQETFMKRDYHIEWRAV